jgi:hypothetical protein
MARRIIILGIAALVALMPAAESVAEPQPDSGSHSFDKREFTCPLGGARFEHDVGYFTYPLVTFPDGSYPGDEAVDAEIPACPGNGLLILPDFEASSQAQGMAYSDYSAGELARLPALIADPAYRAAAADGRHMQAYWLASKLGRPAALRFVLLQRSTWAAVDPALRRKLVERLVEEGPALIRSSGDPDSAKRMQLYLIVNGLRELGRFDEALALIDTIEREGPAVRAPVDPDNMYGPGEYGPQMRAAIAEKDMDRYPVGLMPPKWANSICSGEDHRPPYGPLSATTRAACARRQAAAEAEQKAVDESLVLREDPAALDRACAATPDSQRARALAMACESAAYERDTAAGKVLARDGPRLAAACEATPQNEQKGALRSGCISYDIALGSAVEAILDEDDAAYAILCPGGGDAHVEDRAPGISQACHGAARSRNDRAVDLLLADPAALDARCSTTPDEQRQLPLAIACMRRGSDLQDAERDRLAADDSAFASKCGRFRQQLSKPRDHGVEADESDVVSLCRSVQDRRDDGRSETAADRTRSQDAADAGKDLRVFDVDEYPLPTAEAADEPAPGVDSEEDPDLGMFEETSSLSVEARVRAAEIVAKAKAEGTYPKPRPGDRD